ncbi:MAG: diacylglycerol/lipid kinase family protein [Desulfosudaceae bacterium]
MGGIGVVFNPYAGKNRRHPWLEEKLKAILGDHGLFVRTDNHETLAQAARDFLDKGIDIIAVSGGDGTLHQVLSAVVNQYGERPLPQFGFLRSGTMNTVSNSIKIKGKPTTILTDIVNAYQAGRPLATFDQQLMRVNDKYGFLTGAGVIASFLQVYYSARKPGPVHAAGMVCRMIISATFRTAYNSRIFYPIRCRLTVDGRRLEPEQILFVLGCTVKELGLGFKPTFRAYDQPGHFHLLAGSMSPANLVPKVPALWLGRDVTHPRLYHNGLTAETVLEPLETIPWMIDGDIYTTDQPLVFSAGPSVPVITSC